MPSKKFFIILAVILLVGVGVYVALQGKLFETNKTPSNLLVINSGSQTNQGADTRTEAEPSFVTEIPSVTEPTPSTPPENTGTSEPDPYEETIPEITNITPAVFGNGDTITISGKNFIGENKVFVSLNYPDAITGLRAKNGTLTIEIRLAVTDSIAEGLASLSSDLKKSVLKSIIAQKSQAFPYNDGWYIPATISVENALGRSEEFPTKINVLKGI